jgi:hypothetical protein
MRCPSSTGQHPLLHMETGQRLTAANELAGARPPDAAAQAYIKRGARHSDDICCTNFVLIETYFYSNIAGFQNVHKKVIW